MKFSISVIEPSRCLLSSDLYFRSKFNKSCSCVIFILLRSELIAFAVDSRTSLALLSRYCEWRLFGVGVEWHVMLCYYTVMLFYVITWCAVLCYVMSCYVMLCHVMLRYVMLCYVILCYVMLCSTILCSLMMWYVMWDDIRIHNVTYNTSHRTKLRIQYSVLQRYITLFNIWLYGME